MTESELQNLLNRAVLRMRVECALRWALATGVCALVFAAVFVFGARWFGISVLNLEVLSALPAVFALASGVLAFFLVKPTQPQVASILDRSAGTREHLTTWVFLRSQSDPDALKRSFKEAQAQSTLRAAEAVQLKRDMPVRFPHWSRAFWLALILFISAVLTPAADPVRANSIDRSGGGQTADGSPQLSAPGDTQNALLNSVREIPRVQLLSPTQMRKLELIATDPRLPQTMQADALNELQNAIGGIAESELTPEVRQLLETLRQLNGVKSDNKQGGNTPGVSTNASEASKSSELQSAAEYKAFEAVEKGWSSNEPRFADVKEAFRRYYQSGKR